MRTLNAVVVKTTWCTVFRGIKRGRAIRTEWEHVFALSVWCLLWSLFVCSSTLVASWLSDRCAVANMATACDCHKTTLRQAEKFLQLNYLWTSSQEKARPLNLLRRQTTRRRLIPFSLSVPELVRPTGHVISSQFKVAERFHVCFGIHVTCVRGSRW